jgi:hypothetical protein
MRLKDQYTPAMHTPIRQLPFIFFCLVRWYDEKRAISHLSVELAAFDIDAILSHGHAEILHG